MYWIITSIHPLDCTFFYFQHGCKSPPHPTLFPVETMSSFSLIQPWCILVLIEAAGVEGRLGNEEWKGGLFRKPVIRVLSFNSKSILYTLLCGPRTGNLQTSALLGPWQYGVFRDTARLEWEKGLASSSSSHGHCPGHAPWLLPIPDYFLSLMASRQPHFTLAVTAHLLLEQSAIVITLAELDLSFSLKTQPSWPESLFKGLNFSSIEPLLFASKLWYFQPLLFYPSGLEMIHASCSCYSKIP